MKQCADCRFFVASNDHGGYCHRYPPQIIFETYPQGAQGAQYFPYMEFPEWCGEFQAQQGGDHG